MTRQRQNQLIAVVTWLAVFVVLVGQADLTTWYARVMACAFIALGLVRFALVDSERLMKGGRWKYALPLSFIGVACNWWLR